MFAAVFGSHHWDTVCADKGADKNILDLRTLRRIVSARVEFEIKILRHPRCFDMAACTSDGKPEKLVCLPAVALDTELHIKQTSTLQGHVAK